MNVKVLSSEQKNLLSLCLFTNQSCLDCPGTVNGHHVSSEPSIAFAIISSIILYSSKKQPFQSVSH